MYRYELIMDSDVFKIGISGKKYIFVWSLLKISMLGEPLSEHKPDFNHAEFFFLIPQACFICSLHCFLYCNHLEKGENCAFTHKTPLGIYPVFRDHILTNGPIRRSLEVSCVDKDTIGINVILPQTNKRDKEFFLQPVENWEGFRSRASLH